MQSMRALGTSQLSINPTEIEFDLIDCAKVPEVADTENQHKLQAEINTLGFEIDLKKRLIGELETNNKNLEKMKSYYEDKLHLLYSRIKQIENERDKIIGQLTAEAPSSNDEQIKKIRLDYEFKLQSLQADLHKYQQIKAKNSEMLRQAQENERNLQQLNRELLEMKKLKVKLMNQLKDESIRFKKEEQNRMREIATLKRDHLKKDSQIKFLEAEKKCKEVVLKRKQEQLQALRRNNTTRLSDKASGKFFQNSFNNLTPSVIATNGKDNRTNVNGSSSSSSNGACSLTKNSADMMTSIFKKKGLFSRSFQLKWQKLDQIVSF
jgi:chromosome segregation ATPase